MLTNSQDSHQPVSAAHSALQRETNNSLLELTQSYLKSRLEDAVPDSILAAAWESFYEVYSGTIRRFVMSHGLRAVDADDCAQEVWMEVALRLPDFEHPRTRPGLRAWLYTIVRSKAADFMRRKSRENTQSLERLSDSSAEPIGREPDPASHLEREWNAALVRTLLEELRKRVSDLNYRILNMRVVKGRSVAEVAAALSITPEQVRYRHHRTLRKLRPMLNIYTGYALEE